MPLTCRTEDLLRLIVACRPRPNDVVITSIREYMMCPDDGMPQSTIDEPDVDPLLAELDDAIVEAVTMCIPQIPDKLTQSEIPALIDEIGPWVVLPDILNGIIINHVDSNEVEKYRPHWVCPGYIDYLVDHGRQAEIVEFLTRLGQELSHAIQSCNNIVSDQ